MKHSETKLKPGTKPPYDGMGAVKMNPDEYKQEMYKNPLHPMNLPRGVAGVKGVN